MPLWGVSSEPGKEGFKDEQDQVWRWIRGSIIYLLGNVCPTLSILKSILSWYSRQSPLPFLVQDKIPFLSWFKTKFPSFFFKTKQKNNIPIGNKNPSTAKMRAVQLQKQRSCPYRAASLSFGEICIISNHLFYFTYLFPSTTKGFIENYLIKHFLF